MPVQSRCCVNSWKKPPVFYLKLSEKTYNAITMKNCRGKPFSSQNTFESHFYDTVGCPGGSASFVKAHALMSAYLVFEVLPLSYFKWSKFCIYHYARWKILSLNFLKLQGSFIKQEIVLFCLGPGTEYRFVSFAVTMSMVISLCFQATWHGKHS